MSSSGGIDRLRVQSAGREQLVYGYNFGVYLVGTGRLPRCNWRPENRGHFIQLRERHFLNTLMSVSKLRPMPPTRHWHTKLPTGLAKCDRGNAIFLGHLQHRLLPDLFIKFFSALAAKADVVVVAAGFDPETESEAADRTFRMPPGQDELIREMVAANKNRFGTRSDIVFAADDAKAKARAKPIWKSAMLQNNAMRTSIKRE